MIINQERAITIEGPQDKQLFFRYIHSLVSLISQKKYRLLCEDQETPETIAWMEHSCERNGSQIVISNPAVYINSAKFTHWGMHHQLRNKLIQVVTRHEAAELWYWAGAETPLNYDYETVGRGEAHTRALQDEWQLAFHLGCQLQYYHYISRWAQEIRAEQGPGASEAFLTENITVYAELDSQFSSKQGKTRFSVPQKRGVLPRATYQSTF